MNLALLIHEPVPVADTYTASGSALGKTLLGHRLRGFAGPTSPPALRYPKSVVERLNNVRRDVEAAVNVRRSYLGEDTADALLAHSRAIFDACEWSEDDLLPSTHSIVGTLRAIASIGGEPSLGVSDRGNLTATWQEADRSLSVEGKPDRKLAWAYVIEGPNDFDLLGNEEGSLAEVLQAIQG